MSKTADQLEPLRAALLARATAEADAVLTQADGEVDRLVGDADAEATRIREEARARAEDYAAELDRVEQMRARRELRAAELRRRRRAYDALLAESVARLRTLSREVEVQGVLGAHARARMGAGAEVVPTDDGVLAVAPGREVHFGLTALAERAVAELMLSRAAR